MDDDILDSLHAYLYGEFEEEIKKEIKKERKKQYSFSDYYDFLDKLPSDTRSYLRLIPAIYEGLVNIANKSRIGVRDDVSFSNSNNYIIPLSLFLGFFTNYSYFEFADRLDISTNEVKKYLSNMHIAYGDIDKLLSIFDDDDLENCPCCVVFREFIKEINENSSVEDVFMLLFDEKFEKYQPAIRKIFKELDIPINNIIKEEVVVEKDFSVEQMINQSDVYTKLSLEVSNYIEYLSKIFSSIEESTSMSKINFTKSNILNISIFLSLIETNEKLANYFKEKNITLEKCLEYLNLKDIGINKQEVNNDVITYIYKEMILYTELRDKEVVTISDIINKSLEKNDKLLLKILRDINHNEFDNINNIYDDITREERQNKIKQKIKKSKDFFGKLDSEVIEYIESSYKVYENLKNDLDTAYTEDDLTELSLLLTSFEYDDYEDQEYRDDLISYVRDEMFNGKLKDELNIDDIELTDRIYNDDIDIDLVIKYYKKYIFDGKNKNKKQDEITIEDILCNLFNKELNDSWMLQDILNRYDLDYDDFIDVRDNYKKYKKQEFIDSINYDFDFELLDNIDKIARILEREEFETSEDLYTTASFIYLFYTDSNLKKYLEDRGITLDKILDHIDFSKEEIDNYKELDTNFKHLKYAETDIYNETIEDIIYDLVEGAKAYDRFYEKLLDELSEEVNTNVLELYYELQNDEKYEDKVKRDCLEFIKNHDMNLEMIYKLSNIFIMLKSSKPLDYKKESIFNQNLISSIIIYLFYTKDKRIKYFEDEGITLEKILEYLNITKEQLIEKNEIDYNVVKEIMCNSSITGQNNISDILNNIFNSEAIQNSNFVKELLGVDDIKYEKIKYELVCDEKYEEKIKRDIKNNRNDLNFINKIDKIYRTIESKEKENDKAIIQTIEISCLIYIYYYEKELAEILNRRGIKLDKIAEYVEVPKEEIEKFKDLSTDYIHIYNIFGNIADLKNIDDMFNHVFDNYDNENHSFKWGNNWYFSRINEITNFTNNDIETVRYELLNKKVKLTREERLNEYGNMMIPVIELNQIENISQYGSSLTEHSELIAKEFSEFIYNDNNDSQMCELKQSINDVYKENDKKIFPFIKKKKEIIETNAIDKKEVLDKLNEYLIEKENSLQKGIIDLQYIKKSIAVYIQKANEYIKQLDISIEELSEEISDRDYKENDFRVFDDQLMQQLLNDKKSCITSSVIDMMQQYQQVVMQMRTHASLLNYVNLARNTKLQNLRIGLTLKEGVQKEKESIESLNYLLGLLDNLSKANKSGIVENIEMMNGLSEQYANILMDNEQKQIMDQILEQEDLISEIQKVKDK